MGKGGGGSSPSKTTSTSEPWKEAQPYLKTALSQAQAEFDRNGGLSGQWIDRNMPGLTAENKSAIQALADSGRLNEMSDYLTNLSKGGAQNLGAAQNYYQSAMAGKEGITVDQVNQMTESLYDNDLVNSQKAMLASDLDKQYNQNVSALNVDAAGTGNMGNSRAGVAQANMAGEEQTALAKGTADIVNNARTTAQNQGIALLQNNQQMKASGAQGMLGLGQAQVGYGVQGTQLQQQALENRYMAAQQGQARADAQAQNDWFNATGRQNAGQENFNNYMNAITSLGGMGGSGQTVAKGGGSSGPSTGMSMLGGAASGAAIGTSIMPGWGTAIGAGVGAVAGAFSDPALKTKVRKTGKTAGGVTTYDYQWNKSKEAKKAGLKGKASGALATEVAKTNPEAVSKASSGALGVDYSQIKIKPKNTKKAK